MDNVALANLNNLRISEADVPPEESIFVLSSSQLRQIVQEAIEPLMEEVVALREERDRDREDIAALRSKVAAMETLQESEVSRLCVDIGTDRRRIAALEQRPTTPAAPEVKGETTISRIAKLKEFLKARGGGATFQECERLLAIKPNQMTKLVSMLDKRSFEVFCRAGDGRQRILRLKARIAN